MTGMTITHVWDVDRSGADDFAKQYKGVQVVAAFKSHVECGGAPVALDEIGDWTAPLLNPDPYPEGFFG